MARSKKKTSAALAAANRARKANGKATRERRSPPAPPETEGGKPHPMFRTIQGDGLYLLPLDKLRPSPGNPRKTFDEASQAELAKSIEADGVLQNLVVRAAGKNGRHEIIAGERRYRAIKMLAGRGKWKPAQGVPCKVVDGDAAASLALALIENLQRQDVPPIEEGEGFRQLRAIDPDTWTTAAIAKRINRTQRYVQQRIALVERLGAAAQKALGSGVISLEQARVLALAAPPVQQSWVDRIKAGAWEAQSIDRLRDSIRRDLVPVSRAIFDVESAGLELVTDPDGGKKFFASAEAFRDAQVKAAKAEVKAIKDKGRAARFIDGVFADFEYRKAKRGEDGTTFIILDRDGTVRRLENMVRDREAAPVSGGFNYDALERNRREEDARREAEMAFVLKVGQVIAEEPQLAVRLLALALAADGPPLFAGHMAIRAVQSMKAVGDLRVAVEPRFGMPQKRWDLGAMWERLAGMGDAAVARLLAQLVADLIAEADYGQCRRSSVIRAIAGQHGVALPQHYEAAEPSPVAEAAE